jgi:hypothetical protein
MSDPVVGWLLLALGLEIGGGLVVVTGVMTCFRGGRLATWLLLLLLLLRDFLGFFFSLLVVGGGATVDLAGARCFFFFLVEVWEGATASSVSVWSPSSWQLSEPLADSSPVEKNDEEHAHPLASLSWSNTTATTTNKQQQRLTYLMIDFLNLEIMRQKC